MSERIEPESGTSKPSRAEIIALLNQHKGTAHVWRTLTPKYGCPKNDWGSFCRLVIHEQKAKSNATIGMSINGATNASVNAQSNAPSNVPSLDSRSKTTNTPEHSTPNVPTVIVREPDNIIHPHNQPSADARYQDEIDRLNFQLLMQQYCTPRPAPPPPPKPDFGKVMNTMLIQTMQTMIQIWPYVLLLRALSRN